MAFSAPPLFVLEELDRAIRTGLLVATPRRIECGAGHRLPDRRKEPVLPVGRVDQGPVGPAALRRSRCTGRCVGMYYNRLIVWNLDLMQRWKGWPQKPRPR